MLGSHSRRARGPLGARDPHLRVPGGKTSVRVRDEPGHLQEDHQHRPAVPEPRVGPRPGPGHQAAEEEPGAAAAAGGGAQASLDPGIQRGPRQVGDSARTHSYKSLNDEQFMIFKTSLNNGDSLVFDDDE